MISKKQKEEKIAREKNWYRDKYQAILVQRNGLFIISVICLGTALASVIAVERLAPLKSVEPFVIQVDQKSGLTEVVDPSIRTNVEATEALDNFFVWEYVKARETYDALNPSNLRSIVRVFSTAEIFHQYNRIVGSQNPNSPAAKLANNGTRSVSEATITYLKGETKPNGLPKKVAQVRFKMTEVFKGYPTSSQKLATIEYTYTKLDLTREERLLNPLGFQVLGYRIDEEANRQP
jgi:type IV secretion system protein VirB8